MEIDRNGKLMKWGYWFEDSWQWPARISLCWLFWRVIVFGTIRNVIVAVVLIVISPIIAIVFGVNYLRKRFRLDTDDAYWDRYERRAARRQKIEDWMDNSVVWQSVLSLKSNVCPIIKVTDKTGNWD